MIIDIQYIFIDIQYIFKWKSEKYSLNFHCFLKKLIIASIR